MCWEIFGMLAVDKAIDRRKIMCSGWLPEAPEGERHPGRAKSFSVLRDAVAGKVVNLTDSRA